MTETILNNGYYLEPLLHAHAVPKELPCAGEDEHGVFYYVNLVTAVPDTFVAGRSYVNDKLYGMQGGSMKSLLYYPAVISKTTMQNQAGQVSSHTVCQGYMNSTMKAILIDIDQFVGIMLLDTPYLHFYLDWYSNQFDAPNRRTQ